MSPAMQNFFHEFAAAAHALEKQPELEAEIERLQEQNKIDGQIIADREMTIIRLQREAGDLHERIRSLEVERDDYGFRSMAADDKANALAEVLRNTKVAVEAALRASEPEPVPTSEPTVESKQETPQDVSPVTHIGDIANDPFVVPIREATTGMQETVSTPSAANTDANTSRSEGQSDNPPTASATPQPESTSATDSNTSSSAQPPEPKGPYTGKLYMREPGYINRFDWREGGGTDEAYDWRPGNPLPEGYFDYGVKRSIGDVA